MTFEGFIYKHNPKKVKEDNRETLSIVGIILALFLVYIFLFRGLFSLLALGGIAYALIQIKVSSIKNKGANRFGSLTERLRISAGEIEVGDKRYSIQELKNLTISADDFLGGPGNFFGPSAGTNNTLDFSNNGTAYSYQFQAKSRESLKVLSKLIEGFPKN
jgi:hypothetical protein